MLRQIRRCGVRYSPFEETINNTESQPLKMSCSSVKKISTHNYIISDEEFLFDQVELCSDDIKAVDEFSINSLKNCSILETTSNENREVSEYKNEELKFEYHCFLLNQNFQRNKQAQTNQFHLPINSVDSYLTIEQFQSYQMDSTMKIMPKQPIFLYSTNQEQNLADQLMELFILIPFIFQSLLCAIQAKDLKGVKMIIKKQLNGQEDQCQYLTVINNEQTQSVHCQDSLACVNLLKAKQFSKQTPLSKKEFFTRNKTFEKLNKYFQKIKSNQSDDSKEFIKILNSDESLFEIFQILTVRSIQYTNLLIFALIKE